MTDLRRGQPPLSIRLPLSSSDGLNPLPDLPPASALFLIEFDVRAGYTIVWKRAAPGVELEGVVEYRSLPSGLHTVDDDLIYFVHEGGYAGLSAFVNAKTDDEESRNARMIAVGILVPLSYGRLGRAWRHCQGLRDIAKELSTDVGRTDLLESYWESHGARDADSTPSGDRAVRSPSLSFKPDPPTLGKRRARNLSTSEATPLAAPENVLSPYHPAWSLTSLLDTFGPLIFPIHRAALLRKRILISTHAPVHEVCNFVYNISILSNIPLPVVNLIDPSVPHQRLKPLFAIGVHDIPYLLEHKARSKKRRRRRQPSEDDDGGSAVVAEDEDEVGTGWVACTTDSILAVKDDLWDVLITLPPSYSSRAQERVWPTVESPKGVAVKATQRDLRRFRSLQAGLARIASQTETTVAAAPSSASPRSEGPAPATPGMIRLSTSAWPAAGRSDPASLASGGGDADAETEKIVEPTTWAALAYNGFLWWASAGEQGRGAEAEEMAQDASLLADLGPQPRSAMQVGHSTSASAPRAGLGGDQGVGGSGGASDGTQGRQAERELAIVAYFHRLTTQMFSVLADIVDSTDDDDETMLHVSGAATMATTTGRAPRSDRAGHGASDEGEDSGEEAALLRGRRDDDSDDADVDGEARGCILVGSEALAHMGLDVWSQADADFVRELAARYFLRYAHVEGKGVEVCGLRVC